MTVNPGKKRKDEKPEPEATAAGDAVGDAAAAGDGPQGDGAEAAPAETADDAAGEARERAAEPEPEAVIAELNDKLLRAIAELENFRRRAERERRETAKYAIAAFARDVLTVLDNLRRGLDSVSAEDRAGTPALEALAAGMELTERELLSALERHGVTKMEPLGEPFDYDRHQAMYEVEDETRPAGTVVEVVQPGYMITDRLLRPAMVAVSKGGAKDEAPPPQAANDDGTDSAGKDGAGESPADGKA